MLVLLWVVDEPGSELVDGGASAGEMLPLMRLLLEEVGSLVVATVSAEAAAGLLLGFMNGSLGLLVLEAPNRLGLL